MRKELGKNTFGASHQDVAIKSICAAININFPLVSTTLTTYLSFRFAFSYHEELVSDKDTKNEEREKDIERERNSSVIK